MPPRGAVQELNQRLDGFLGSVLCLEGGPLIVPRGDRVFPRPEVRLRLPKPVRCSVHCTCLKRVYHEGKEWETHRAEAAEAVKNLAGADL